MPRHRRTPVVRARCIIERRDGRLLVQWDPKKEAYVFPGGRVEYSESIPLCLVREMKEEAGIIVEPDKLMYIVEVLETDQPFHEILFYFTCNYKGNPRSRSKFVQLEWRRLDEFIEKLWPQSLAEVLAKQSESAKPYYLVIVNGKITFIKSL